MKVMKAFFTWHPKNKLISSANMTHSRGSPENNGILLIKKLALEEAKNFLKVDTEKEIGATLTMSLR